MAHIYKRENGVWWLSYQANGRRVRHSLKTKKRNVAQQLLAVHQQEVLADRLGVRPSVRLSWAVEQFLASRAELAQQSQKWYAQMLGTFRDWLPHDPMLDQITPQALLDYRAERAKSVSPATVKASIAAITVLMSWAIERKYLGESPVTSEVRRIPRLGAAHKMALTRHERAVYALALRRHPLWGVYALGIYAGLRRGEIVHFERADVRDGHIVLSNKPHLGFMLKDYESRQVPVCRELSRVIDGMPERGPAIPTPSGRFWDGANLGAQWRKLMARLQLPPRRVRASGDVRWGVTLHELRHTYASIQIQEEGVDIWTLARRMGHSSITTTQGYFHEFKR